MSLQNTHSAPLVMVVVLSLALYLLPLVTSASTTIVSATATCVDNGNIVEQNGGPGNPVAICIHKAHIDNIVVHKHGMLQHEAFATPRFRSVGVRAKVTSDLQTNIPDNFGGQANASSQLLDTFIMDAQYPDGTPIPTGLLQINAVTSGFVSLDGNGSVFPLSTAELDYTLLVGGAAIATNSVEILYGEPQVPVVAVLSGVIAWTAGVPITISMTAIANVDATLTFSGMVTGESNFGNSLTWTGITNVTDDQGMPVAFFTALSPEGLDWGTTCESPDTDGDGVGDPCDNCMAAANEAQRDTDGDGIGNACDSDLSNDCAVNFADLAMIKDVFFSDDDNADFDGDGSVNFADLNIMKGQFFGSPGPSGIPNDCDVPPAAVGNKHSFDWQ